MTTIHTPGPWAVVGNEIEGDGMTVVTITEYRKMTPRQAANARLIAAAPDLLAAMQALDAHGDWAGTEWSVSAAVWRAARAAIARATGAA